MRGSMGSNKSLADDQHSVSSAPARRWRLQSCKAWGKAAHKKTLRHDVVSNREYQTSGVLGPLKTLNPKP